MNRSKLIPACAAAALLIAGSAFAAWLNYFAAPTALNGTQQELFASKVRDLGSLLDLKAQELTAQYRAAIKTKSAELEALQKSFAASELQLQQNLHEALQSVEFLAPDFERALVGPTQSYTRLTLKASEHDALLISTDANTGMVYAPESLLPLLQLKTMSGVSLKESMDQAAPGGSNLRLEDENSLYCVRLFTFGDFTHALIFPVDKPDYATALSAVLEECAKAADGRDPNLTLLELYYNEQDLFTAHIPPASALKDANAGDSSAERRLTAEVPLSALPFTLRADGQAAAVDLKDSALSVLTLSLIASAVLYLILRALSRRPRKVPGAAAGAENGMDLSDFYDEPGFILPLRSSAVKKVLDALRPDDLQTGTQGTGLTLTFKHNLELQNQDGCAAENGGAGTGSGIEQFIDSEVLQALSELNERIAQSEGRALKAHEVKAEAKAARVLQLALLPAPGSMPKTDFLDIAALQQPCITRQSTVYDLFWLDENNIAFFAGSAEGSGLKASVSAALAAITLRQALKKTQHTAQALTEVNAAHLSHQCLPADFICCILNEKTGNFVLGSAGKSCALRITPQEHERLGGKSPALGTGAQSEYKQQKGTLVQGDVLLLLSPELISLTAEDGQSFEDLLLSRQEIFAQGCDDILLFVNTEAGKILAAKGEATDSACIALKQLQIHF